nr:ATP-binding cassette domain-containing protein [Actinomyces sp.]
MTRAPDAAAAPPPEAEHGLAVRDLTFAYTRHSPELFESLSHSFAAGRCTALTGPSGRGKSTLLYVLGLILAPRTGQVLLDGVSVADAPDTERSRLRASRIGFVFQDSELDAHRTLTESVAEPGLYAGLSAAQARERARRLLGRLGLADQAGKRPTQVSGGQAQRAAVCRALLMDPDVVLADEPTGNLDRGNAAAVLDALDEASQRGCTVVIATHDPYVVDRCQEVVEL